MKKKGSIQQSTLVIMRELTHLNEQQQQQPWRRIVIYEEKRDKEIITEGWKYGMFKVHVI